MSSSKVNRFYQINKGGMSKDRFSRNKDLCQPTSKRMFTSRGLFKEKETWKMDRERRKIYSYRHRYRPIYIGSISVCR